MDEPQARAALLMRAADEAAAAGAGGTAWRAEDTAWATRQAAAEVGASGTPAAFVAARSRLVLARLGERAPEAAAWVQARLSSGAWLVVALLAGAALGLALDQLGPPQRVNLLAPAVWAVVAWNLAVCAGLGLRALARAVRARGTPGGLDTSASVGPAVAGWLRRLAGAGALAPASPAAAPVLREAQAAWLHAAAPLLAARAALVLHVAAAAVAAGLIAGLYLRGLVLDYRAGWQSTFLGAAQVQALLDVALAPAAAVSGVAVPAVGPLRLEPAGAAEASAAPWIHLYAMTLALVVLLPRSLLGTGAWLRARFLESRFPLSLESAYFEGLHPLMRPGAARALRLVLAEDPGPGTTLFDQALPPPGGPRHGPWRLLESELGDGLDAVDARWRPDTPAPAPPAAAGAGWRAWLARAAGVVADGPADPLAAWRREVDAIVLRPEAPLPPALAALARPVLRLPIDAVQRGEGWLREARLLAALDDALGPDPRLPRLADAWRRRETARLQGVAAVAAAALAAVAMQREPLPAGTGLLARRGEAEAGRERLLAALAGVQQRLDAELAAVLGQPQVLDAARVPMAVSSEATPGPGGLPSATAVVHRRVGEGRAALLGGALGGALVGLKADLATGGLTLGTGALAGGVIGALGAAGAAHGVNRVRGVDHDHVAWDDAALGAAGAAFAERALVAGWRPAGLAEAERQALAAAWTAESGRLQTLWRSRPAADASPSEGGRAPAGEALAGALAAVMQDVFVRVLGGPAPH